MFLSQSISATIKYAKYFNFSLSRHEVHHWLISNKIYPKESVFKLYKEELAPKASKKRQLLNFVSKKKLSQATQIAKVLSLLPSIRLIAVTGSVAISNAKPTDDIDLLIITSPHTLWLTRPLVFVLLKLLYKRRRPISSTTPPTIDNSNVICDNLWLDMTALRVMPQKRNLYTAHELMQLQPVFERDGAYQCFLSANFWVSNYLANAYSKTALSIKHHQSINKKSPPIIKFLNLLAFKLQYFHMRTKMTRELVSVHFAYFHPRDLSLELNNFIIKD